MRAVQLLIRNTYRHQYLDGLAMREEHFQLLTELAKMISVATVSRPRTPYRLDDLVDALLQDFSSSQVE